MATIPVYSPVLPFLGLIPGGLHVGKLIRIKGQIHSFNERLQINIQTGAALKPRDDVLLHLSIRPYENAIVRNSMKNHNFEAEERYGGCPIHANIPFEILILVEPLFFKIAVNGTHFCTFNHRITYTTGRFISLEGGATVHSITTDHDQPNFVPPPPPYVNNPGSLSYPTQPHPTIVVGFVPPPGGPPPPYTASAPYPPGSAYPPVQPKKDSNTGAKIALAAAGVGIGGLMLHNHKQHHRDRHHHHHHC